MSQFSNYAQTAPSSIFDSSTTPLFPLGEKQKTNDGREFVYVKVAAAAATVAGSLYQAPIVIANHQGVTVATTAAGSKTVTVTLGATLATVNQYAGGYITISAGTGVGYSYKIASHPAAAQSATLALTLEDPILVATAVADSKACLNPSNFLNVIASVDTAKPVGVATFVIPASSYGFLQTKGQCAGLNKSATAVNLGLASSTTSGAFLTVAATTAQIATALQAGVDGEVRMVDLNIL